MPFPPQLSSHVSPLSQPGTGQRAAGPPSRLPFSLWPPQSFLLLLPFRPSSLIRKDGFFVIFKRHLMSTVFVIMTVVVDKKMYASAVLEFTS